MSVLCVARYLLVAALPMFGQTPVKSDSILSYSRIADGVDFQTRRGVLSVRFSSEAMIHVLFRPGNGSQHPQPWITRNDWPPVRFTLAEDAEHNIILATRELRVIAERDSSALVFEDGGGRVLLREVRFACTAGARGGQYGRRGILSRQRLFRSDGRRSSLRAGATPERTAESARHRLAVDAGQH